MPSSTARDVGVQSWSFREFKALPELFTQLKAAGVSKTELCGVHCNFDDPAAHQPVVDACKAAGIQIVSIGVQTFTGDVKKEKQWFEFAKKAGAKHISAHFRVDSFREAVASTRALSEVYGIRVGVHCHGGYMFGGSVDIIQHLIDLGQGAIGINIDTAWCMQAAGNPVEWVKKFAGRVYGIHYKDFLFDRAGKWSETVPGEGTLDLPALVKALDEVAFDGMAVIEYEADPKSPTAAITRGVQKIRAL